MNTSSTPAAGSSSNGDDGNTTMDGNNNQISQDLPFLVTHWLANYNKNNGNGNGNNEETTMTASTTTTTTNTAAVDDDLQQTMQRRAKAMAKIRKATADIASAFASLGAFGTTTRPSLQSSSSYYHQSVLENRTFSDLNRMHSGLIPSHLEHLAQSVVFNNITANTTAMEDAHTNYLIRANSTGESLRNKQLQLQQSSGGGAMSSSTTEVGGIGLSVQEAIILDNADDDEINNVIVETEQSSILQNPTLIDSSIRQQQYGKNTNTTTTNNEETTTMMTMVQAERDTDQPPSIDIKATHWDIAHQTAETMREFLTLREKVRSTDYEIRSLEASMTLQQDNMNMLNKRINDIATGAGTGAGTGNKNDTTTTTTTIMTATEKLEKTEQCKVSQQESGRVICQLQRKLSDLITNQNSRRLELIHLENKARTLNEKRQSVVHAFRDPFTSWKGDLAKGSRVGGCVTLQSIVGREQGLSRARLSRYHSRSNQSRGQNPVHFLELRKNLLSTRLSHAVTINTHMNYPVYCLRFDRTGRYFITGADDFLLKVFYLGAGQSCRTTDRRSRQLRCNYGANFRGAVLVCTLRGHAGVINDIDVSWDNCLLATASDDGDVRVWGLKTGCPIAILRGHKGGANMVSWSTLTPYRLVSTGSDGFARVWDVREACLKRYSNIVSQREEYNSRLTNEEKKAQMDCQKKDSHNKALSEISAQTKSLSSTTTTADMDGIVTAPAVESLEPPGPPPLPLPSTVPIAVAGNLSEPASGDGVELVSENNIGNENISPDDDGIVVPPLPAGIIVPPLPAGIIIPPLPAAVPPLGQGADGGNQVNQNAGPGGHDAETAPGQFVFNDLIDEGVKLLSKYQHGSIQEEHHGPGTRSRRGAINVICVARCPLGKQFVTGSDDGICRVWEDFDDSSVEIIDGRLNNNNNSNKMNLDTFLKSARPSRSGIESKPLLKLMGHVSTITDLAYSNAGDRILSASQSDGVVRLWNIGIAALAGSGDKSVFKDKRVTQIVIKLTNPFSKQPSQPTRRRKGSAARNASSKVCCDVAVWTHDDSYIITSQCVLIKENKRPIQPGSQFLCLWDSKSGQCLIGISGAHTLNCQVVIPHPMDASIFCTGSIDGTAKVWDWTQGKCIFSHRNKVELGPPDPKKPSFAGYLDGSFSPDGSAIVLTDECGQITVLDSISKEDNPPNSGNSLKWMREQYFANDYYDLAYDRNGYCIERGSGRPPHLAPKSARCAHNGTPCSEDVNETYKKLVGPSPLPKTSCTWHREQIRANRVSRVRSTPLSPDQGPSVRIIVREFDPLSTIIIRGVDHTGDQIDSSNQRRRNAPAFGTSGYSQGAERNEESTTSPTRPLESANYRYLDYDDLIQREGDPDNDEPESDDEEFEPVAARRARRVVNGENESDDDDDDDDNLSVDSRNNRHRSRQQNQASSSRGTTEERRVRAQRRARSSNNNTDFVEIDSDDDMIAQFVSINKTATGPFLRDYTLNGHYWQLKSRADAARVRRKWLQREDSDSSYFGRKVFTPQMGDSVVYIPRAHFETIKECPSLSPPWQSWPTSAVWPVVRCFVRGVRYRFPYEDYFRGRQQTKCSSIVTILTLEVTGIPELSEDREFPWPKPSFIEPARPFVFELSVFENTSCEYVISETLYTSRISSLENHIRSRSEGVFGLEVDLYYEQERHGEDLELQAWPATIEEILPDEGHSDVHLQGSGYGVVQVWDGAEENRDSVSPWELNTDGADLARPCMTMEENKSVLTELNRLLRKNNIANHLSLPVDQERYFDYANMVEIPMDMMFVKRRLAANYYGSNLGVAADLRLIRDNCIKYNTTENEMSEIASTMCNEFEANVLSDDERLQMISEEDFDKIQTEQSQGRQVSRMRIQLSSRRIQEASQAVASSGGRYTLRNRTGTSSLENLPAPENNATTQRRRSRREVNNEVQNARNRGRNEETEVLGQMSRLRRRGGATDGGREARAQMRTQRNENDFFPNEESRRGQRRQPLPESPDSGNRRSTRARNNVDENRLDPHQPPRYNDDYDDEFEEEVANTASASRTARRSSRGSASHNEENDDRAAVDRDAATASGRVGRPARRTSSRAREEESDGESDEEMKSESEQYHKNSDAESQYSGASSEESDLEGNDTPPPAAKRKRSSPRSNRNIYVASSQPAAESSGRRSSRGSASQRTSYEEVESDEEQYAGSDSEESNGVDAYPTRKSDRNSKNTDYHSLSESDQEESEEEEISPPQRTASKRKRSSKPSPKNKKAKEGPAQLPDLKQWPDIEVGDITMVANEILRRIADNDQLETFAKPVLEAHPEITDVYLSVVVTPMDLRTIEEEKLHYYNSIHMLQDDLILMFRNCCTFNAPNTEFWVIAKVLWEDINQIFFDSCHAFGVLLPRNWKP